MLLCPPSIQKQTTNKLYITSCNSVGKIKHFNLNFCRTLDTVYSRYIKVYSLQISHKRHPHLLRRDMIVFCEFLVSLKLYLWIYCAMYSIALYCATIYREPIVFVLYSLINVLCTTIPRLSSNCKLLIYSMFYYAFYNTHCVCHKSSILYNSWLNHNPFAVSSKWNMFYHVLVKSSSLSKVLNTLVRKAFLCWILPSVRWLSHANVWVDKSRVPRGLQ